MSTPDGRAEDGEAVGPSADVSGHDFAGERRRGVLPPWLNTLASEMAVMVVDAHGRVLHLSPQFEEITGHRAEDAVGRDLAVLNFRIGAAAFRRRLLVRLLKDGRWQGELRPSLPNGTTRPIATTIFVERPRKGPIEHFVVMLFEARDMRRNAAPAAVQPGAAAMNAMEWPSPVLANGRTERRRTIRAGRRTGIMFMIRLEQLDLIRRRHGGEVVRELVQVIAARLHVAVRSVDPVGHMGDDDLVLIVAPPPPEARVAELAEEIADITTRPVDLAQGRLHVTARVRVVGFTDRETFIARGPVLFPEDAPKPAGLSADGSVPGRGIATATLWARLRREALDGLRAGDFFLRYQPVVFGGSGKPCGLEALLRWNHPDMGRVGPDNFSEIFGDPVIQEAVGVFVRDAALDQARSWTQAGVKFGSIAVNATLSDLDSPHYVDALLDRLKRFGLPPSTISIEVTEGVFLSGRSRRLHERLNRLHQAGVEVALDDFGTGYASLAQLRETPFRHIKIDRSFVSGLVARSEDKVIVSGLINMAHDLGMTVTAEGVELNAQFQLLRHMGCDRIQGYFISPPLPAADVAGFLLGLESSGSPDH